MLEKKLNEINRSIEIDEEGYPVFDGLRIDDPKILSDVFQNIRRTLPTDPKSKIITFLDEDKWAWVDAFDAPFVVQTIDHLDGLNFLIHFFGGVSVQISFEDLMVDEWNRFHLSIGEQRLPAVFSRKAQASILNVVSQIVNTPPTLPYFRSAESRDGKVPSDSSFWSQSYSEGSGWELGQAHPKLKEALQGDLKKIIEKNGVSNFLVPGAGRGQDALLLAQYGKVVALDFAKEAKADFVQMHKGSEYFSSIDYKLNDVFEYLKGLSDGSVDAVFEHTFFCAIEPIRRKEYVEQVLRVLKPNGGLWFGVFFLLEHGMGPPFALTQWELREYISNTFETKLDILEWERIKNSPQGRAHKELWAVFRKN